MIYETKYPSNNQNHKKNILLHIPKIYLDHFLNRSVALFNPNLSLGIIVMYDFFINQKYVFIKKNLPHLHTTGLNYYNS